MYQLDGKQILINTISYNKLIHYTGECYMNLNTASTITLVAGTFIKVSGTTTSGLLTNFSTSNNKLTYTGTTTNTFSVNCTGSIASPTTNQSYKLAIFKNGSLSQNQQVQVRSTAANDKMSFSLSGLIALSTNDFIELYATDITATNSFIVEHMNLNVKT